MRGIAAPHLVLSERASDRPIVRDGSADQAE
jgi:hypothetical protein